MYVLLKKVWSELKNIAFPPRCVFCHSHNMDEKTLCSQCYEKLTFLAIHKCQNCGYKAEHYMGGLCGQCIRFPPVFSHFYGVAEYDDFSASFVHQLKFYDRLNLVPVMARLMASELYAIEENIIITSVPLHWRRRLKRRFNQSAELARHIAQQKNLHFIPDLTWRVRNTAPQLGQSGYARQRNLKNAFLFNPRYEQQKRTTVILVDDVLTTGSTLQAVAKVIKAKGFDVHVLVFARVEGHLR